MMTSRKNMGGSQSHSAESKCHLKNQMVFIKTTEVCQDFIPIGSAKEENLIKKMNEKATGEDTSNKEKVLEEPDSTKVEVKQEGNTESTRKRPGRRLKMKATKKSKRRYPIVDWKSKFYHTNRYGKPHDYYRVFRANGSSRYIKTFTEMVSRFIQQQIDESGSHNGSEKDLNKAVLPEMLRMVTKTGSQRMLKR
ncbi:hypothetical protein Tco_0753357 [Tanacetum coccineum]